MSLFEDARSIAPDVLLNYGFSGPIGFYQWRMYPSGMVIIRGRLKLASLEMGGTPKYHNGN